MVILGDKLQAFLLILALRDSFIECLFYVYKHVYGELPSDQCFFAPANYQVEFRVGGCETDWQVGFWIWSSLSFLVLLRR